MRKLLAAASLGALLLAGVARADPVATSQIDPAHITPAVTAGAYSAGYLLGAPETITPPMAKGFLQNVVVDINSGTYAGQIDLIVMDLAPTGTYTDNTALALTAADNAKVVGTIHVSDCTVTATVMASCQATVQGWAYWLPARVLYVFPVVRSAVTLTGTSDVTIHYRFVE